MSQTLPENGLWRVADGNRGDGNRTGDAPFELIKLDLRGRQAGIAKGAGSGAARGTVRARNLETRLGRIRVTGPDRFVALYDIRGHRGVVEGTVRPDGSLRLDLSGTVTGAFVARPAGPADAEAAVPAGPLAGAVEAFRRSAGMALTAAA